MKNKGHKKYPETITAVRQGADMKELREKVQKNLTEYLIKWETAEMPDDEELILFEYLINSGMAFTLQGIYGRQTDWLIRLGCFNYIICDEILDSETAGEILDKNISLNQYLEKWKSGETSHIESLLIIKEIIATGFVEAMIEDPIFVKKLMHFIVHGFAKVEVKVAA